MPWPVAIALGAIVAPPDAAAATAVMRQVKLPHKLLKILEGESLLNDASALLVYRLAIMTVLAGHLGFGSFAPVFLLTLFGSLAAGVVCAYRAAAADGRPARGADRADRAVRPDLRRVDRGRSDRPLGHPDARGVCDDRGAARRPQMPARMRVPIFAVWETVVFVLNAFAFVLIGMQLRPIWQRLEAGGARTDAIVAAAVVLGVTIAARFAWVMSYKR